MKGEKYLFVVSGPSGTGKDTVVSRLLGDHKDTKKTGPGTTRARRGGGSGGSRSVNVCMVPRILSGVVGYYLYRAVSGPGKGRRKFALAAAGVAGSLTNTLLVMNLIYFLFGSAYGEAVPAAAERGLYPFIVGVICLNGFPKAVLAGFLTVCIVSALQKVQSR